MSKGKDKIPTLDLHGYKTDEVFDAIEAFLGRYGGSSRVRIIPGKGSGKVMAMAKDYLSKARYPFQFENEGSLLVFCD